MKTKAKAAKADVPKAFGDITFADLREPTEAEMVALKAVATRAATRPARVQVKAERSGQTLSVGCEHKDQEGWSAALQDVCGTSSRAMADRVMGQLTAVVAGADGAMVEAGVNAALAVMGAVAPKDELEAILAAQMIATNHLAMEAMRRAAGAQVLEAYQTYIGMATKLSRTFTAQMEALSKFRGGGEQKVTVIHEHRHTYVGPGGQAIIGDVHTGGGGESRIERQSHGAVASLAFAPGSPVWSEDPTRDAMPVSGDEGQEAVSHARERRRAGG